MKVFARRTRNCRTLRWVSFQDNHLFDAFGWLAYFKSREDPVCGPCSHCLLYTLQDGYASQLSDSFCNCRWMEELESWFTVFFCVEILKTHQTSYMGAFRPLTKFWWVGRAWGYWIPQEEGQINWVRAVVWWLSRRSDNSWTRWDEELAARKPLRAHVSFCIQPHVRSRYL